MFSQRRCSTAHPRCALAEVGRDRRIAEMEFYFPLNLVTPAVLEEVFARHGTPPVVGGPPAAETIERLHFAPTRGYMKGFIDLVFEHRGRFYLIDWKSNRLGAALEDYHCNRLGARDARASLPPAVSHLHAGVAPVPASPGPRL